MAQFAKFGKVWQHCFCFLFSQLVPCFARADLADLADRDGGTEGRRDGGRQGKLRRRRRRRTEDSHSQCAVHGDREIMECFVSPTYSSTQLEFHDAVPHPFFYVVIAL